MQAVIRALGRKRGERLLKEWADLMATEESVRLLFPTRAASERAAVAASQRQALAWMRQAMPVLIASIPRD